MTKEYKKNIKLWKQTYSEILKVCEKYPNFNNKFSFYDIQDIKGKAKNHLLLIEWYEKYDLKLDHSNMPYTKNYISIDNYKSFQLFTNAEKCKAEGQGRYISWSNDGKQPEDGWYFVISFLTGAFIFGDDYEGQRQLFQDFFQELKNYKPDYLDTANQYLYWKIKNAKKIYENFDEILKKYYELNKSELDKRKAKKLRAELKEIENKLLIK